MATKKRRRTLHQPSTAAVRVSLTNLPIEILAEILLYTCSPPTVLAVSRACSFLYRSLALNPDASFIWRGVRKICTPAPLPDPGDCWKGSEADYTALVFGGGVCEVCHQATRAMYASFSARIRLCTNWHCRATFLSDFLVNVTSEMQHWGRHSIWVPPVESTRCFYPARLGALVWPRGELMFRKRDWEGFQRDLKVYDDAELALVAREHDLAPDGAAEERGGEEERILKRCRTTRERLPQIMELSIRLVQWKWDYDQELKAVRKYNETWTKRLAETEGWNLKYLIQSQTYGSMQRRKTFLLEKISPKDVTPIRPTIESELLALQARHERQEAEATYRGKLSEVKKVYERMRCGTLEGDHMGSSSGSNHPSVLPPLSVFCALPSVRALKGSPDPNVSQSSGTSDPNDINSTLAISLIKADIHTWQIPIQKHLTALMGYPNGWQSASTRTLHPLKRVTAWFYCRRCGQGKVGKAYQKAQCLDFKGVCSHVCMTVPGKGHMGDGSGQEKGKSKGKKNGSKTLDWQVDVFEKDEKAIRIIKMILSELDLSEESATVSAIEKATMSLRCLSCKGWIFMDFETALGHAHRHETMEIQVLPAYFEIADKLWGPGTIVRNMNGPFSLSRPAFERGNCDLLLGPSYSARRFCKMVNYGCRHCIIVEDGDDGKTGNQGMRRMDFNGLRSHVKEKHGIQNIGDEDFFCYTSIKSD